LDWLRLRGSRVGHYELLDEIARGGMGIVYRARQRQPARIVAVKMLLPYLAASAIMQTRFRIESDTVARLDHPGILPIYEVGEHDGIPYFSMKFAEEGSLAKRMPSLASHWREIATIIIKVADAIQHAHDRGILHRDLKPGNVLFDGRGEPMVADFGLAKFRAVDQNLTLPTSVLGSPSYMAPEQVDGAAGGIGPATDVYSLGAILYELLTGRPPIVGHDPVATLQMVTVAVPDAGALINPSIPSALDAIALKCLEKKPERRYRSASELAEDLNRWLRGEPAAAARSRSALPSSGRFVGTVVVSSIAALLIGGDRSEGAASSYTTTGVPARRTAALPSIGRQSPVSGTLLRCCHSRT
jgi:serine/threonine-protein kinase